MDKLIAFDRKVDTTLSKTGLKLMTGVRSLVSRDKFRYQATHAYLNYLSI